MVKEHKKLYKSGKNWMIATLFAASLGVVAGVQTAQADEVNNEVSVNSVVSTSSSSTGISLANNSAASVAAPANSDTESSVQKTAPASETVSSTNSSASKSSPNDDSVALKPEAAKVVTEAGMKASDLTTSQINELNKVDFSTANTNPGTAMTLSDLDQIDETLVKRDSRYAIPYFNASQIKNMSSTRALDAQTGQLADLDIWDAWPVQDPETGYVSNYHGYQLVVAMMGEPGKNDNHIYLLYNKYGDNDFSHWRNAGSIFGTNESPDLQEWSGSAIINADDTIQLFYTLTDTRNGLINKQQLATANLVLTTDDRGVTIAEVKNNHVIFTGDGQYYQTYEQYDQGEDRGSDNFCLRDAHVVQTTNGDRYLAFEGSTGSDHYQSIDQIYKWTNYGGDSEFNLKAFLRLTGNQTERARVSKANAALGILKLTNDQTNPQVADVYSPLVSALMVTDELERPNVVKLGDKFYLFSATRIDRGVDMELTSKTSQTVGDNVAMIGYVADSLLGHYTPLNGSGVVLTASVPFSWRTATYSYYAVPVAGHSDLVLITSYMSNRGFAAGKGNYSTLAPSFLLQIKADNTTQVLAKLTNQGDWIWDDTSENDEMIGILAELADNSAALPDEWKNQVQALPSGYGSASGYAIPYGSQQITLPSAAVPSGQPANPTPGKLTLVDPAPTPANPTPGELTLVDPVPTPVNPTILTDTQNTPQEALQDDPVPGMPTTVDQTSKKTMPLTPEKGNKLPQTGNAPALGIVTLGMLSMLGMTGVVASKRRCK